MRIIKSTAWSFAFACKHCKSELEAEAHDIRHSQHDVVGEDFYVNCAVCGRDNVVPHASLTPKVVREVEARTNHTISSYAHRESFLEKTLRKKACSVTQNPCRKDFRADDGTCVDCGKAL